MSAQTATTPLPSAWQLAPMPTEIAEALFQAQQSVSKANPDGDSPDGYTYVRADTMVRLAREALHPHGLFLTLDGVRFEAVGGKGHAAIVRNVHLRHRSGQFYVFVDGIKFPVESGRMPFDKSTAAAMTTSLAYFVRDLLQIERLMPGDEIDQRRDAQHALADAPRARGVDMRDDAKAGPATLRKADIRKANLLAAASASPVTIEAGDEDREREALEDAEAKRLDDESRADTRPAVPDPDWMGDETPGEGAPDSTPTRPAAAPNLRPGTGGLNPDAEGVLPSAPSRAEGPPSPAVSSDEHSTPVGAAESGAAKPSPSGGEAPPLTSMGSAGGTLPRGLPGSPASPAPHVSPGDGVSPPPPLPPSPGGALTQETSDDGEVDARTRAWIPEVREASVGSLRQEAGAARPGGRSSEVVEQGLGLASPLRDLAQAVATGKATLEDEPPPPLTLARVVEMGEHPDFSDEGAKAVDSAEADAVVVPNSNGSRALSCQAWADSWIGVVFRLRRMRDDSHPLKCCGCGGQITKGKYGTRSTDSKPEHVHLSCVDEAKAGRDPRVKGAA